MVQDMEVGLNISTTWPYSMLEKVLMELVEVDICLRPVLLPPIISVIVVDHLVLIFMVITEVEIVIPSAIFLHITMVN